MKLAVSRSLALLTSALFTILPALADFKIVKVTNSGISEPQGVLEACASGNICDCMNNGAPALVEVDGVRTVNLPANFFSVKAGLCGSKQLNFYNMGKGVWYIYVDHEDGTLKGQCSSDGTQTVCSKGFVVYNQLVCTSSTICA